MTDTLTAPTTTDTVTAGDVRARANALEHVTARIAQDPDLPAGVDPRRVMEETLKYLDVAADSDVPVSPSKTVDIGWHHFILFTRDYMDYCASHLGRFVHHVPDEPTPDPAVGAHDSHDTYLRTRQLVAERFGDVDTGLWPDAQALADCQSQGNCSSECSGDCSGDASS